jgi:hypothetical protein
VLVAPFAAAAVGTTVHRLGHFLHEGAHFNVAPDKAVNDRVTNATVGVVVLTDVRVYRPIHMVTIASRGRSAIRNAAISSGSTAASCFAV